ncbi:MULTISPECIES: amino acid ABC transporter permease [unclassified Campylobacter]|uniref:amino acid ABC transporter permease n=1 Tax=unclassified Campylobacter TaxID=2593542 RepID=UPI00123828A6|nr:MULTISPECIES: amino acid ABC transporter permease [unclassified Campylobacter]KAA6225340.1 amino acid ABC transporter permease [Campylobacter sp. LR185c]KAA6227036.1 amino acid ABC transporter permease [Campylobacter sp. LR196d]KAA6227607.1 amino acid ABC transporter permease [Campylobacter sp. LR286c]KAA6229472.1 amino acid ABC transporter permease [Campylobacter sp. LR264d]KAA6230717.1 amino acid ABC transporter permease [Campylobacter sp. LR291e]
MQEKNLKLFIFFATIILWGYFSFPYELLQVQKDSVIVYEFTPNAKIYLQSYVRTLILTLGAVLIGLIVGFLLAILKTLRLKLLNVIIDEYIDIIRGTPVVLQLMIFAYVIFVFLDNLLVGIIALGLNASAYIAEVIRSGINSVDKGQMEAARAMGLNYNQAMRLIILPQAFKNILPALTSEIILVFKDTSVVGFISIIDITMQSKSLQAILYNPKPIIFTGLIYYISVKIFSFLMRKVELRLKKDD